MRAKARFHSRAPTRKTGGYPTSSLTPDFRGMTMRAVLAEAAEKGLTILPDGSGVARLQDPPPGAALHPGERIRVQFAR